VKRRLPAILLFVLLLNCSLQAESSLFGPSKSEVALRKLSEQNRNEIAVLSQHIYDLNERVDGLTTVIEGLNATIRELQLTRENQQSQSLESSDFSLWKAKVDRLSRECVRRQEPDTSRGISYKSEEKKSYNRVPERTETAVSHQQARGGNTESLSQKSNSVLYREGVRLFQKHQYGEAEKRFSLVENRGYKPAASNYYLGEIAYYTKKYSDAVYYYKKSAGLYDKASYIDTLLLHTAISLERTGDKTQARAFYQTIIDGYAGKKSAEIAKKMIRKL